MGFLIFAARKLQLKSQINGLQFRSMQLSQEQQTVASQIANAQKAVNAAKNSVNYMTSISNAINTVANAGKTTNIFEQANKFATRADGTIDTKKQSDKLQELAQAQQTGSIFGNTTNTMANFAGNIMNSVFDATSQVQLSKLNAQDSQISLELENIDSQMKLKNAEYENVKKAESEEARNAAPTFGLA